MMLQGGNSISIHLQPSFRNSLSPLATFAPPTSAALSLLGSKKWALCMLNKRAIFVSASAPVRWSRRATNGNFSTGFPGGESLRRLLPLTSAKLTVAVIGLGVPVRKLLITLTLSGWSNPDYYTLLVTH